MTEMQQHDELHEAIAIALRAYRTAVDDDLYGFTIERDGDELRARLTHIVYTSTGGARIEPRSTWMPGEAFIGYVNALTARGEKP